MALKSQFDLSDMPYFQYLGRKSNEMGMRIRKDMELVVPESVFETIDTDGRNSDIIVDRQKYKDIDKVFPVRLYKNPEKHIAQSLREVAAWLYGSKEYTPIVFSEYSEYFYKGFAYSGTTATDNNVNGLWVDFDVTFKTQPFVFRVDGEEEKVIYNNTVITNPEEFESYPLIKFTITSTANDAHFYINGRQFTFKAGKLKTGTYVVDNELGIAYSETTGENVTSSIMMTNAGYQPLILEVGRNLISFDNMTNVIIKPRWRTLAV